jgi:hypothetical protein
MSIKKLILNHGIDIVVTIVLLSYILMDVKVPVMLNNTSQSIMGLIVLSALALLSFIYFHPVVGILAIVIIFKMIVDNRHVNNTPYLQQYENMTDHNEHTETFASQMPTSSPEEIRSNDDSLEEEVIANMAPLISSSNYMNSTETDNISPVMASSGGSSLA